MEEPAAQSFEDPKLKAALRRVLGSEGAPAGLRERIAAMAEGDTPPIRVNWRQSWVYKLAVAAVLVVGVGGLAFQVWKMNHPYNPAVAISDSLYEAMLTAHHSGEAASGVTALAKAEELKTQINRPVLVADLTRDGWRFDGGGVRKVGDFSAAQLKFSKGKASISVFSLPAKAASGAQYGAEYDTVFNGSPIAGFLKGSGLYCIVGSSTDGSLTVDEVKRLLAEHKGDLRA
jgi:hypothetical protein